MSGPAPLPPAVAALLARLEEDVRAALGAQFSGLYLYGSLAMGDFNPATSDVDFLVVTDGAPAEAAVARLRALHEALWAGGLKWADKLEGTYLPRAALPRYDPDGPPWPTVNEGRFYLAPHGPDWVIQRHVLRTWPRALSGPPLRPWMNPLTPDDIRQAVAALVRGWWVDVLTGPQLERSDYQAYAMQTMCRALVALETGQILSKPAAAARIRAAQPDRAALIDAAQAWLPGEPFNRRDAVAAFVSDVIERAGSPGP